MWKPSDITVQFRSSCNTPQMVVYQYSSTLIPLRDQPLPVILLRAGRILPFCPRGFLYLYPPPPLLPSDSSRDWLYVCALLTISNNPSTSLSFYAKSGWAKVHFSRILSTGISTFRTSCDLFPFTCSPCIDSCVGLGLRNQNSMISNT